MGNLWCQAGDIAAGGKTAGTFDEIAEFTIPVFVKHILGIIVLVTNSIPTSGENGIPILRINSTDLGISSQDVVLSGSITDAIATNNKEMPVLAEFIPFKEMANKTGKIANTRIAFGISSEVSTTGGWDVVVGLVTSDELPDASLLLELMAGICGRFTDSDVAGLDAGVNLATPDSFTETLVVPAHTSEIIGLAGFACPNAPTDNEACAGWTEFTTNDIPNFSPQQWPFIVGWGASLGTPVGSQGNVSNRNGMYWPTRFQKPPIRVIISAAMTLATALTNAADGVIGVKSR